MAQSPRPLHELLGRVFREHRREEHLTLATLQQHWAELVGPGFAGRTWPARLQQGTLWIAAPDSSWAYQLQFLKQELLAAIRTGLPAFPVRELRFKVGALPASQASAQDAARSDGDSPAASSPDGPPGAPRGRRSLTSLTAQRTAGLPRTAPPAASPVADSAAAPAAAPAAVPAKPAGERADETADETGAAAPGDAARIAPELLRAAGTIADPTLRAAFLRALDKQARRQEDKG